MSSKTFNIVLPEELVKQADKVAKSEFKNRSELIREALRVYVARKKNWDEAFNLGDQYASQNGVKSEEEVAQIVREYREGR